MKSFVIFRKSNAINRVVLYRGGVFVTKSSRKSMHTTVDEHLLASIKDLSLKSGIPQSKLVDRALRDLLNSPFASNIKNYND